jgi:nucleoside diphosphate kinase
MEKSVFMIKPEGMSHKEEIMSYIEKNGLAITRWRTMLLDEDQLKKIYHDTHGEIWEKTKEHMLGKEVLVGEVNDEQAIEKLKTICGSKTNPIECDVGSIRKFFNDIAEKDPSKYHKNIIHRAMDDKEVTDQTILFFPPSRDAR